MDTLNKILALLEQRNIEQQEFAKAIGVRKQAITEWKKGTTKSYIKYIDKIADFLGVSTDYLLGTTEITLGEKQAKIIELTSQLTEEEQEEVIKYAELLKRGRK